MKSTLAKSAGTKKSLPDGSVDAQCRLGMRPKTANGYFEEMTKAVFRSGMKWEVVDKKWPDFKKAFHNFSIQKVAGFGDRDLERLMNDSGIIRNHKKVTATLANARKFLSIRREYGSFTQYLKTHLEEGEEALCRDLGRRFCFMGGATCLFFLRAVGETMPRMMEQRRSASR